MYVEAEHAADTVVVEREVVVERVVRDDGKQNHFLENLSIKTHVVIALVFVLLYISIVSINKQ